MYSRFFRHMQQIPNLLAALLGSIITAVQIQIPKLPICLLSMFCRQRPELPICRSANRGDRDLSSRSDDFDVAETRIMNFCHSPLLFSLFSLLI